MNAIGKWMICVWLAVLCTTQTTANSTNPTNTHDTGVDEAHKSIARSIWQLLSDGSRKVQYAYNQDIVAVLGLSGVGRSTFVLFMTGNNTNLIARQVRNQRDKPIRNKYLIDDVSKRIGRSNTKSFTQLPEKLIDETTGTIYYDMPGFVDTRDAAQDIAGGYYIKRLLDSAKSVKFVVMSNFNALQSGADKHAFMTLISHLAKLIRNIGKFQGGIALIATKVPDKSDEQINVTIVEYLETVRDELTTNKYEDVFAKQLINILLETDSDGNYKFFHHMGRVRSEGPLSELQNMQENRVYLKKTVEKHLNYIPISKNDFDYTISDASKLYLNEVIENCYSEIEKRTSNLTQEINYYVYNSTKKMQNTLLLFYSTLLYSKSLNNYQIPDVEIVYKFKNKINQIQEGLKTLISRLESEVSEVLDPFQFSAIIDQISANFPFDLQPKFSAASSEIAIQAHLLVFSKQFKINVNVTDNSQNNNNIILLSHFRNTLSLLRQTTDNLTTQAEIVYSNCYSEIIETTSILTQEIHNFVYNLAMNMQNTFEYAEYFYYFLNHPIPDVEIVNKFKNNINQIEEGLKTLISRLESEVMDPVLFPAILNQVSADFPFDLQPKFAAASSEIAIQAHWLDFSRQLKKNANNSEKSQNNNNIILLSHFKNTLSVIQQTTDNLTTQAKSVITSCYSEIIETTSILTQEINNFVHNSAMNMQNTLQNLTNHQISEEIAYNYKNKINQIEDALNMLIGRIESEVNDPKTFSDVIDHVANSFPSDLQPKFTAASSEIAIQARLLDFARQIKRSVTENSGNNNNMIWLHSFKKPLSFIKETTQNLTAQAEIVAKRIMQNIREQFQKSGTMLRLAYERKEADDSINIEDLYYEFKIISEILYSEMIGMTSVADCVFNTIHLLHKANFSNAASIILPAMPLAHNFEFLQIFTSYTYNFDTCVADFHKAIEFFKSGQSFYRIILDTEKDFLEFKTQKDTNTCLAYANKYFELAIRLRRGERNVLKEEVDQNCKIFSSKCIGYYFCDVTTLGNTKERQAKLSVFINYILDPKVEIKCENNKLAAKGTNVKISEVIQNACWPTATEVIIFALETCFIDKDVDKSGMNATVTIIARVIEVVGWNRQINLSGPDGAPHVPSKAENGNVTYVSGAPGKAGNAGGPGGDCLLIAERITNGDVLTIIVQGGRGGPGQDGGDGYSSDCAYRTPPSIIYNNEMSNWQHLFHFKRIYEYRHCPGLTCQYKQCEVRLEPTEGGSGGDGGYGGDGGPSGIGVIALLNSEKSANENGSHWSIIAGSRRNGANGIPGNGGAGKNGAIIHVYEEWRGFFISYFRRNEVTMVGQIKCYVGNKGKILERTVSPSLADPRTAQDLIYTNALLFDQYNSFALSRPSPIAKIFNVPTIYEQVGLND